MELTYREPGDRAIVSGSPHVLECLKRLPATAAALTCTAVGVIYNAEFARQFGGAAIALAVSSDVLKSLAGPIMIHAIKCREWGRAVSATAVLLVTLTVSLVAAFGGAQHRREAATDDRTAAIRAFDDTDAKRQRLEFELGSLGLPRPVEVIQAEVEANKIDMTVWRRSNKCSDISLEDTKRACGPVLELYKEKGAALRKVELEANLEKLQPTLLKGKPEHADPQSAAIAELTGLSEDAIRRGISLLLVAAIEVGAIGGSIMAGKPAPRHLPVPANSNAPAVLRSPNRNHLVSNRKEQGRKGRKPDQRIVEFSELFSRKNRRHPSGSEIKAAFPELPTSTAYDYAMRCRNAA